MSGAGTRDGGSPGQMKLTSPRTDYHYNGSRPQHAPQRRGYNQDEQQHVGASQRGQAPLGPGDYGYQKASSNKESGVQRLKRVIRNLREANASLEADYSQLKAELQHYQGRIQRVDEGHRLEIARLKKEVEYHKRLRQGAEQRTLDLEDRLKMQQRQTSSFDEAQSSLIEQSQILISKNSELTHKMKVMEAQVAQLQELKECLEAELADVYQDRDRLAQEIEQVMTLQHQRHLSMPMQELAEGEEEGEGEGGDAAGSSDEADDSTANADDSTAPSQEASSTQA